MSGDAPSRLSHWGLHGSDAVERGRTPLNATAEPSLPPDESSARWATRALRSAHAWLRRLSGANEPATAHDLLRLAQRVESDMPNLAAELRVIAMHRS